MGIFLFMSCCGCSGDTLHVFSTNCDPTQSYEFFVFFGFFLWRKSYNQLSSPSSWPPFTHTRDTLFCPKHLIFPQILHVSINLHLIFYVSSCWCVYMFTKHSQHKYVSFHYSIFPSHLTNIAINSVCFFFRLYEISVDFFSRLPAFIVFVVTHYYCDCSRHHDYAHAEWGKRNRSD